MEAAIAGVPPRERPFAAPQRFVRAHPLALIVALGLAFRLALLATPRSYFPDEIFQYLEAAHRLVFGVGVVPWEYRFGIRSWLVPLLLAGPMAAGGWLRPDGVAYLLLPKLLVVLVSLGSIVAAARIGARLSPRHGLYGAFAMAIWSETALFGTQALTEALAVPLVLGGAALLETPGARSRTIAIAGALLALAVVVRFQYAPAVAALVAIACRIDRRRWLLAAAGGGAVLVAAGGLDMAMGQWPFGWIVENFHQNIGLKRSHAWVDGPGFYPLAIAAAFGATLLPAWALARLVARRFPALVACAITNVAVHTLIAHKEYRYVLLSTSILVLLAGIATPDAIDAARRRFGMGGWAAIAVAAWLACSGAVLACGLRSGGWDRVTPALQAFAALRQAPGCGVALLGRDWTDSGGYTYLHRPVPLYIPDDGSVPPASWIARAGAGFDLIVAPARLGSALPSDYRRTTCFGAGQACLYRRSGGCDARAASGSAINWVLIRLDR
ncbi:hypothetical protein [Sphingomonas sp.]|uniref:hypothetical protein n=1 Tax=Sphingomonas sp. TaxID=28214 RepID=UPI003B0073B8